VATVAPTLAPTAPAHAEAPQKLSGTAKARATAKSLSTTATAKGVSATTTAKGVSSTAIDVYLSDKDLRAEVKSLRADLEAQRQALAALKASLEKPTAQPPRWTGGSVDFLELGYTHLAMGDINAKLFRPHYGSDALHDAAYVGMFGAGGVTLWHDLIEVGPHAELIGTGAFLNQPGGSDSGNNNYDIYETYLVPITLEARFRTPGKFSVYGALGLGEGIAGFNATVNTNSGGGGGSSTQNLSAQGTCPVYEARLGLRAGQRLNFRLEGGYRSAVVSGVKISGADVPPVDLDFSGWNLGIRLGYDF
jgi:hypothetical protein